MSVDIQALPHKESHWVEINPAPENSSPLPSASYLPENPGCWEALKYALIELLYMLWKLCSSSFRQEPPAPPAQRRESQEDAFNLAINTSLQSHAEEEARRAAAAERIAQVLFPEPIPIQAGESDDDKAMAAILEEFKNVQEELSSDDDEDLAKRLQEKESLALAKRLEKGEVAEINQGGKVKANEEERFHEIPLETLVNNFEAQAKKAVTGLNGDIKNYAVSCFIHSVMRLCMHSSSHILRFEQKLRAEIKSYKDQRENYEAKKELKAYLYMHRIMKHGHAGRSEMRQLHHLLFKAGIVYDNLGVQGEAHLLVSHMHHYLDFCFSGGVEQREKEVEFSNLETAFIFTAPTNLPKQVLKAYQRIIGGINDKDRSPHHDPSNFVYEDAYRRKHTYKKTGILVHTGSTTDKGHYVAYVRDAQGDWYRCDDQEGPPKRLCAVNRETVAKELLRRQVRVLYSKVS